MAKQKKLYEGSTGVTIDIPILNAGDLTAIIAYHLKVIPPGGTRETAEIWPITVENDETAEYPWFYRHVVPSEKPLIAGDYVAHPYIEIGDFKGYWGKIKVTVSKLFS